MRIEGSVMVMYIAAMQIRATGGKGFKKRRKVSAFARTAENPPFPGKLTDRGTREVERRLGPARPLGDEAEEQDKHLHACVQRGQRDAPPF